MFLSRTAPRGVKMIYKAEMNTIQNAPPPNKECSSPPVIGIGHKGFSGWYSMPGRKVVRGEFSDRESRSCFIEDGSDEDLGKAVIRVGPAFERIGGVCHKLTPMVLDKKGAKQLVAALDYFIEHGHLRQIPRLSQIIHQWWQTLVRGK